MGISKASDIEFLSAKQVKYDIGLGKKPQTRPEQIKLAAEKILSKKPKRVVVDPVNSLILDGDSRGRSLPAFLIDYFNKMPDTTKLLLGESFDGPYADNVIPFLSDGIILLRKEAVGSNEQRALLIDKMRLTNIKGGLQQMKIVPGKGIVVG